MSFVEHFLRHAELAPSSEAISADGISISYFELVQRVERQAASLAGAGVGPGATVGIAIADEIEHLVACLALLRAGAWQVALASHDTEAERGSIAARVHATHVLSDRPEFAVSGAALVDWPPQPLGDPLGALRGGILLRTSGTTGGMNIVPLTDSELAIQSARNTEYSGGRLFRPASIEHNNSKRHRLYCAYMGGTNVLRRAGSFDVADYCRRHRVTTLDLALMQAADLAATTEPGAFPDIDIRVSGSAVPIDTRRRIEERLTRRLYVRYGSTETGTISSSIPGRHDETESVGPVVSGLELEIVDGDGIAMAYGEAGHIRLRGAGIAEGYFETPEQTQRRFRDGWFWPGDMGRLHDDGSLVVVGRADDMINLNGINIFPAEIERVLERHPAVQAAAALPLNSPAHGQIPVAAVELHPETVAEERELIAYAREHLALRAPRRILVLDKLPRNSQGKVLRQEIGLRFKPKGR